MANNGEVDHTDRWLVRQRFIRPTVTDVELGREIGMSSGAISKRFHKASVIKYMEKMNTDIYIQAIAIREQAMKNAMAYVKSPESKEGFEMTKMFAQAVADSQATMPDAPSEAPTFFDPGKDDE
jgi:hypothetical protein